MNDKLPTREEYWRKKLEENKKESENEKLKQRKKIEARKITDLNNTKEMESPDIFYEDTKFVKQAKKKKRRFRKWVIVVFFLFFLTILIVSSIGIYFWFNDNKEVSDLQEDMVKDTKVKEKKDNDKTEQERVEDTTENPETSDGILLFVSLAVIGLAGTTLAYRRLHN